MKDWITRLVFLYISFFAAAFVQNFHSRIAFNDNFLARDALALLVIIFLFGLVFLAPYYYFAKKVLPSPRTLFGANVVDIVFGLLLTLAAIIWIYFPQRQGVSFADGTGLIIDKGVITEYGHQVKLRHVLTMVLISSFYILFCGLWQRLR